MGTVTEIRKPQPEKVVRLSRTPAWIKRMQDGNLKPKDFTNGSFVPAGSERGA
jgi:hypothetical protein